MERPGRGGHARRMATVVVTGGASQLGRRVCELVTADPGVDRVIAVDLRPLDPPIAGVTSVQLDLATADLKPRIEGADAVLHLASVFGPDLDGPEIADGIEVQMARRLLDAASAVGVTTVVVLSSAAVYGAWANNPVPLTEDAPVRPQPELTYAVHKAEVERLAADWRDGHPGAAVALLRPAPLVGDGWSGWIGRSLDAAAVLPTGDTDPPAQYLHVDDLAAAVDVARRARLDGPHNVAPDGWLTAAERRALDPAPRIRLPERAVVELARWRWRLRLAPIPPGILPYARHPWVVANDRLKAAGWVPSQSNEEAYVAGHEPGPIEAMSPRRRQEVALGAAGAALAALGVGGVALLRRRRRPA
ncbi:MAG: hypothetical protein JWM05_2488 [Acidimicrobiales bacterium]|nr:hypothetical protein [Acidimicrobiales bacterium]